MFCAPGTPEVVKFWGNGNPIDDMAPWPAGSELRLAIMTPDRVPAWVIDIVKSAADKWIAATAGTLEIRWVSGEASDIRISFRTDRPTFAYVGARASLFQQTDPTINFNFGGWKDDSRKAVYSHAYVWRLAFHLLGHAFGL